jgi:chaperonin GroES
MSIQPNKDKVLIKRIEQKSKMGSLIIPDSSRPSQKIGVVVAIGNIDSEFLSVGDQVIYAGYAGVEITHEGEDYLLLNEIEIYCNIGKECQTKDQIHFSIS